MQLRRKSRWRSKNARKARAKRQRCAASAAWADETRRLRRADRAAQADESLAAEARELPVATPTPAKPQHVLEVRIRMDGEERTFRAAYVAGEWIGDSGNLMARAIRVLMRYGPTPDPAGA